MDNNNSVRTAGAINTANIKTLKEQDSLIRKELLEIKEMIKRMEAKIENRLESQVPLAVTIIISLLLSTTTGMLGYILASL